MIKTQFLDKLFYVDERVLIPRKKTETTARVAIKSLAQCIEKHRNESLSVIDVGTGCGNIIISLALSYPLAPVKFYGFDLSSEALQVAKINAIHHQIQERISLQSCNLIENLTIKPDIIIANLPYLSRASLPPRMDYHEPELAIYDHDNTGYKVLTSLIDQISLLDYTLKVFICENSPENIVFIKEYCNRAFINHKIEIFIHKDEQGYNRTLEVKWL